MQTLDEIPTITEMLQESHKLKFQHFETTSDHMLVLGTNMNTSYDGGQMTEQEREARDYREWKLLKLNIRDEPFQIDPVLSSEQSEAQFSLRRAAMQDALRVRGPSLAKTSPVFDGDLLLATCGNSVGVSLYKVEHLNRTDTPRTVDITMFCQAYEHQVDPNKSGLHGKFVFSKERGKSCKRTLKREDVVVFNVHLVPKKQTLTHESLKMLARALPEQYAMPDNNNAVEDESSDEQDQEQPTNTTARNASRQKSKPRKKNSNPRASSSLATMRRGPVRSARPRDGAPNQDSDNAEDFENSATSEEEEEEQAVDGPTQRAAEERSSFG